MVGGFVFVTLASCLWVLSDGVEPRRLKDMRQHAGLWEAEQPAACPPTCHCYINILSCHPEMPLGPHTHDGFSSSFESAATTASSLWNATGVLTQVPRGIRGTMSGNVMTPFTVLDFRDNNISSIWKDDWLLLPKVEYLNLKGNRLTDLIPDTFEDLSLLKYLFLSYNSIRFIADYIFQPTPEIELIDISNNKLLAIQRDLFRTKHGLRFLKVLDLSNNHILILGPGAFSHLSSLHFLNISNNYLSLIGEGAFDKLNSVIYL
ncbi:leucine-rich repeat-containing protein 70-like [Hypanus sabinus]|uniref:leucine-rich repeat-containing protein 70-like n=1 Tax=Hypanus sabinus TaxID=79690 RepID=UPI0028C4E124|nr:leucine-rich repeat-containing protein 70-like [Hypanus sabinus]